MRTPYLTLKSFLPFLGLTAIAVASIAPILPNDSVFRTIDAEPVPTCGMPDSKNTSPNLLCGLSLDSDADDVKKAFGGSDPASYISFAQAWKKNGDLETWEAHLWPPGVAAMNRILIEWTGSRFFILKRLIITIFLWSFAAWSAALAIQEQLSPGKRLALCTIPAFLATTSLWIFGIGNLTGESVGIPLFVATIAFLYSGGKNKKPKYFALSGALIGIASYFRQFFEFLPLFLVPTALCLNGLNAALARRRDGNGLLSEKAGGKSKTWKLWAIFIIAFVLVTWPWKTRNYIRAGVFSLNTGHETPSYNTFSTTHLWSLPKNAAPFAPTVNVACQVDPDTCEMLNRTRPSEHDLQKLKRITIKTMLKKPFAWLKVKLVNFNFFWVGIPWRITGPLDFLRWTEGLIFLLAGVVSALWMIRRYPSSELLTSLLFQLFVSFLMLNIAIFWLLGYEARFSVPLRLFFYFLALFVYSENRHGKAVAR